MVQNGSSNVHNGKANKFSDILHPILCKSDEMKTSKFCYSAFFFSYRVSLQDGDF